jgi:hypothetical protein
VGVGARSAETSQLSAIVDRWMPRLSVGLYSPTRFRGTAAHPHQRQKPRPVRTCGNPPQIEWQAEIAAGESLPDHGLAALSRNQEPETQEPGTRNQNEEQGTANPNLELERGTGT